MAEKVSKELLKKYLNKECSTAEQELVNRFLNEPDAEMMLNEVLSEELETDLKDIGQRAVSGKDQKRWESEFLHRATGKQSFFDQIRLQPLMLKVAATFTIIVSGFGGYQLLHPTAKKTEQHQLVYLEMNNPKGRRTMITLTDSTVVYLGAASGIKFPKQFSGRSREIFLYGEAFFEVRKDPAKPFIVHTGTVQTRVLGTSFKIEAFNNRPLEVAVATGKVSVDFKDEDKMKNLAILTPGWKLVSVKGAHHKEQVNIAETSAWKNAILAFSNQPVSKIMESIERTYNVKVSLKNPQKGKERLTLRFDSRDPLNKVMTALAEAGQFKYQIINRETVIIK